MEVGFLKIIKIKFVVLFSLIHGNELFESYNVHIYNIVLCHNVISHLGEHCCREWLHILYECILDSFDQVCKKLVSTLSLH